MTKHDGFDFCNQTQSLKWQTEIWQQVVAVIIILPGTTSNTQPPCTKGQNNKKSSFDKRQFVKLNILHTRVCVTGSFVCTIGHW